MQRHEFCLGDLNEAAAAIFGDAVRRMVAYAPSRHCLAVTPSDDFGVAQPSSVTRAINRLSGRSLIYDSPEGYRFFSPFFRTWLLTQEL